jgi:predicted RNA-binding Zn-ribbon protein involved in translation (DUF1610 family)
MGPSSTIHGTPVTLAHALSRAPCTDSGRERAYGPKPSLHEEEPMLRPHEEDVELECPECGARVKATAKEAEKGKVRCPSGHEFAVMAMLGDSVDDTGPTRR